MALEEIFATTHPDVEKLGLSKDHPGIRLKARSERQTIMLKPNDVSTNTRLAANGYDQIAVNAFTFARAEEMLSYIDRSLEQARKEVRRIMRDLKYHRDFKKRLASAERSFRENQKWHEEERLKVMARQMVEDQRKQAEAAKSPEANETTKADRGTTEEDT